MTKLDKKYWCKLCTRYHSSHATYLQHKTRFEKRKGRRKKKFASEPTVKVDSAPVKKTKKDTLNETHLVSEQIVTTPSGNKILVSDDPAKISEYLKKYQSAKAIANKDVAKQVANIMSTSKSFNIKKIPTITAKPGKGTPYVEELISEQYGVKPYTCEDCIYFVRVRGQDACIRWKKSGFDFSQMKDIKPCTQFRMSEWM